MLRGKVAEGEILIWPSLGRAASTKRGNDNRNANKKRP
jgi:hypothetical protein